MAFTGVNVKKTSRGMKAKELMESEERFAFGKPVQKVGARNPYSVAEAKMIRISSIDNIHKILKKLPWQNEDLSVHESAEKSRQKLSEIFGMPYKDIFDTRSRKKSPIFRMHARGNWNISNSLHSEASPCEDKPEKWDVFKTPSGAIAPFLASIRTKPDVSLNGLIDDTIQGCARNCYFVAALCSAAWHYSTTGIPREITATTSNNKPAFEVHFWNNGDRKIIVEKTLPVRGTNQLVYCRESPSKYEIWVAIYEKAYAAFKDYPQSTLNNSGDPNDRDYSGFDGGNALAALENLTAKTSGNDMPVFTQNNRNACFGIIETACKYYNQSSSKTNYPMVAWTYDPDIETPPSTNVLYQDEVIVANHTYSILGTYKTNGKNYVVLRNPWGPLYGVEYLRGDPKASKATDITLKDSFGTGSWQPAIDFSRDLGVSIRDDGIFGLSAERFEEYFKAFGWVVI